MNSPFSEMPDYAFPRLRKLLEGVEPSSNPSDMSIGEPKHIYPTFIDEIINPDETRNKIITSLNMLKNKVENLPKKKHGNIPL